MSECLWVKANKLNYFLSDREVVNQLVKKLQGREDSVANYKVLYDYVGYPEDNFENLVLIKGKLFDLEHIATVNRLSTRRFKHRKLGYHIGILVDKKDLQYYETHR